MQRLVIHADDFGLSEGVNRGILEAIQKGGVTSTSALVNFPCSLTALQQARSQNIDVGWHINVTEGRPLTHPELVPSLVQKDGTFYPLSSLIVRSFLGQIEASELERELRAQVKIFYQEGLKPSHADGHQHIHIFPQIRDVVRKIMIDEKIPIIRVPCESGGVGSSRFMVWSFLRFFYGSNRNFWQGIPQAIPMVISFYGLSLGFRGGDLDVWKKLLRRISADMVEVMVHPGLLSSDNHKEADHYPGDRQGELKLLVSQEWKLLIQEMGFKLASFRDLLQY